MYTTSQLFPRPDDFYAGRESLDAWLARTIHEGPANRIFPVLGLPEGERYSYLSKRDHSATDPPLFSLGSLASLQREGLRVRQLVERNMREVERYLLTAASLEDERRLPAKDLEMFEDLSRQLLLNDIRVIDPLAGSKKELPFFPVYHLLFPEYGFALDVPFNPDDEFPLSRPEIRRYRMRNKRSLWRWARNEAVNPRLVENVSPFLELEAVIKRVLVLDLHQQLFGDS